MAPERNEKLILLFDKEFERLRRIYPQKMLMSLEDMSKELQLDPTVLSHYRHGRRALSGKKALQIAKLLRRGASANEVNALAAELRAASPATGVRKEHQEEHVIDWFSHMGTQSLIIVEFGESPSVRPFGPSSHLADAVSTAVINGMSYAMMYPYCPERLENLPSPLATYLRDLHETLVSTYWSLLRSVLRGVRAQYGKNRDELRKATNRLKLYRLRGPSDSRCPAIGYRLFYLEPKRDAHESQRWQWITHSDGDHMLRKESSSRELEATVIKYFPIAECWRASDPPALPSDAEMIQFVQNQESYCEQFKISDELPWRTHEIEKINALIEEFLR